VSAEEEEDSLYEDADKEDFDDVSARSSSCVNGPRFSEQIHLSLNDTDTCMSESNTSRMISY